MDGLATTGALGFELGLAVESTSWSGVSWRMRAVVMLPAVEEDLALFWS